MRARSCNKFMVRIQEKITKGFTEEEKATFLRLLQQVEKNLDELTH